MRSSAPPIMKASAPKPAASPATAITAESVAAANAEIAQEDRERVTGWTPDGQLVAGQWVAELYQTRGMLGNLGPAEWEHVAAFLTALLERAPVKESPAYEAERILLGALAWELREYARSAGEPVGLEADLRAASSRQEEQRLVARLEASREAFHAQLAAAAPPVELRPEWTPDPDEFPLATAIAAGEPLLPAAPDAAPIEAHDEPEIPAWL